MDVPSIAAISMTHKAADGNISSLAADDTTWFVLIQGRFGIDCNHRRSTRNKQKGVVLVKRSSSSSLSSERSNDQQRRKRRPKTYGGTTWKDAYRSLSSTMRIPETSITSGSSQMIGGGAVFASPPLRGRKSKNGIGTVADFFGVWCMVNHAENCRTKTVEGQLGRRRRRRSHHDIVAREPVVLPYRLDRRYIELKLCLQNTKSGFGRVVIPDVSAICIASLDEEDYFSSWGWDKWDSEYDATFKLVEAGPWAPKILLRRRFNDDDATQQQTDIDAEEWNATCDEKDLILRPFEVVILSIHISCPQSHVYETDVLSSLSSIRVPIVADGWPSTSKQGNSEGCFKNKDVAIARFLPEDTLWEYYCLLPGGCMSLTDRSSLVPI